MLRSVFAFFCYLFGDFDFAGSITSLDSNFFTEILICRYTDIAMLQYMHKHSYVITIEF